MNKLCQFRNLLGKPNTGFHKQRFLGFALYDILGTIGLGILVSYITGKVPFLKWSYFKSILIMFLLGVFLHWLFCVDTAFMRLFKSPAVVIQIATFVFLLTFVMD
jgi:hypothetical protein